MGTEKNNDEVLAKLWKLIKGVKHLQFPNDDAFAMRFVRAKKGDSEAAFKVVTKYYEMRQKHQETFKDLHPSALEDILKNGMLSVLKSRSQFGARVLMFRFWKWDVELVSYDELFLCLYLLCEELISDENIQENGIILLIDAREFSWNHLKETSSLAKTKRSVQFLQGAFPGRFKGLHIINEPSIFDILLAIARPFMSAKLKQRLQCHGTDWTALHESLSRSILPEIYGGDLQDEAAIDNQFMETLFQKDDYYKTMLAFGFNRNSKTS